CLMVLRRCVSCVIRRRLSSTLCPYTTLFRSMIEGIQSGDTFSAITGGAGALGGGLMIAGGALSATGIGAVVGGPIAAAGQRTPRSEEHTSELQSRFELVCRLLLEKKKTHRRT